MPRGFAARAAPPLARARLGVFGYFTTSGFLVGVWAAGLPALDERLALGPGRLGTVLLLIATGALVAMSFVGRACDRFSSRTVARLAGPLSAAALLGPTLAPTFGVLTIAAVVYGLSVGVIEVSMNVNSVEVEARYRRPIVSAFHGFWSLGGAVGGAGVTAGFQAGVDAQVMLLTAIALGMTSFIASGRPLLPRPAETDPVESEAGKASNRGRMTGSVVLVLGVTAFAAHLSEGAAMDWAAIHARRVLDVSLADAPIAYTVFGIGMTGIRLLGDPIRARLGSARTLLWAGIFSTAGYGLALGAALTGEAAFVVACLGWALTGIGLATVVPVIFSAVGAAGGAVGKALSMVTMFGSAGLLVGPAVIGHLADATSLPLALSVPGALALVILLAGPSAVRALGRGADLRPQPVAQRL